jgi:hypothetical protein
MMKTLSGKQSAAAPSPNSECEFHIADRPLSAAYEWTIFNRLMMLALNRRQSIHSVLDFSLVRLLRVGLRLLQLGLCLGEEILELLARLGCKFGGRTSHNDSTLNQFFENGTENGPDP